VDSVVETVSAVADAVVDAVDQALDAASELAADAAAALADAAKAVADAASGAAAAVGDAVAVVTPPSPSESGVVVAESSPPAVVPVETAPAPAPTTPTPTTPTPTDSAVTDASSSAVVAAPQPAGLQVAKVFEVRNPTELLAALRSSRDFAGAEIRVYPGNYGDLKWTYQTHAKGRVYVVAATSTMPVFTSVDLNGSANLSFHGMKVAGAEASLVRLNNAANVTWSGGLITSVEQNNDPWDGETTGLQIRFSRNVTVQDVKFQDLRKAVWAQRSSKVNLRYNTISHMREGFNIAAVTELNLLGNHFSYFYPKYQNSEHPDAIQFWTNGETIGSTKVRIRENVIVMGAKRAIQGVFMGCETAGVRYADWEVSRNVYYGSSVHGLSLNCIDGLKVWNNVVVASPHADVNNSIRSADGKESGGYLPQIRVTRSTGAQVWNNLAMTGLSVGTQGTAYDNFDIVDAMGWGGVPWTDVLAARPTAETPRLAEFVTRNPSLIRTRGGGIPAVFTHGIRPMDKAQIISDAVAQLTAWPAA
jgi:hypothetical protein